MAQLDLENLDQEERAFIELMEGVHRQLETLKVAFPSGRFRTALDSAQEIHAVLIAAAIRSEK